VYPLAALAILAILNTLPSRLAFHPFTRPDHPFVAPPFNRPVGHKRTQSCYTGIKLSLLEPNTRSCACSLVRRDPAWAIVLRRYSEHGGRLSPAGAWPPQPGVFGSGPGQTLPARPTTRGTAAAKSEEVWLAHPYAPCRGIGMPLLPHPTCVCQWTLQQPCDEGCA
jgi:hypothetical protein